MVRLADSGRLVVCVLEDQDMATLRQEKRLRGLAAVWGYAIRKDRAQTLSLDHQGGYMLVDADRNCIIAGDRFDLDLGDLEKWLVGQ
jgi:hypothetical protein